MSLEADADVIIRVEEPELERIVYVTLNDSGYSKYWKRVYDDGDVDEYWFEYNAADQFNRIKAQTCEGSGTLDYSYENGNIIGVKMTPSDGGTMRFFYGNTPIKNVGGLMIVGLFGIDDDDMQYAYYAGILGKSTSSLPLKKEGYFDGESFIENYTWTINDKGLPTKLTTEFIDSEGSDTEDMYFVW